MEMKQEYAVALHNAGLYTFVTEDISEETVKDAVEIRLSYQEGIKRLYRLPVLVLNAEFLKNGVTQFKLTIKEENPNTFFTPANRKKETKMSRKSLLERFLIEVKNANS